MKSEEAVDDDEDDPLDAFMAGVEVQAKRDKDVSVQKAATKSSNKMPQPPRQPKPLNRLSAQATGPGLAASKKRNSAKAANCPQNPMGMASHSTSQKATTSSQTMAPGSATPMWRAVTVQAHQPSKSPRAIKAVCAGKER